MCGIAGIVDPAGVDVQTLRRMTDSLRSRGPDDAGLHVEQGFGLGHRRLSIIDLAAGHQPMSNEDGTVWITYNGELYNYRELRAGLEARHRFATRSDTEVIVHLYEELGPAALQWLRGMFAFAIYDRRQATLLLARDHFGQKPLYYVHDGTRLAFGSEIKALLAFDPALAEMDEEALYEYLTLRIVTPPRSMFRSVRKLPPAHYLIFRDGRVTVEPYWQLRFEPKRRGSLQDHLRELDLQVRESVRHHLVADVEVGAFLSGGLDSSLVLAFMSQLGNAPVKTFTGLVPYDRYSEAPYARMVRARYGARGYEFTITPSLLDTLPEIMWHLDEPSDPLCVCLYYLAQLARREVKVVLGGDGGDELFAGYDRYYGNRYVAYYALLPEVVRRRLIGPMLSRLSDGGWYRSTRHQIRWLHELSFFSGGERYARSLSYFYLSDRFKRELYTPDFRRRVAGFDPEAAIARYFDGAPAREMLDRMLFTDAVTRLPDHPVMVLDRMTMAHGLEARSPFLDHKLAEFCASIPAQFKIRGRRTRYIQLKLAEAYLPSEILHREKQGFSSPFTYLLERELGLLFDVFLSAPKLVADGHLEGSAIRRLLDEHRCRRADHGQRLWLLCAAEVWYRMYIHREGRDAIHHEIERVRGAERALA